LAGGITFASHEQWARGAELAVLLIPCNKVLPVARGAVRELCVPFMVILAVPLALLGAIAALWLRGMQIDVSRDRALSC